MIDFGMPTKLGVIRRLDVLFIEIQNEEILSLLLRLCRRRHIHIAVFVLIELILEIVILLKKRAVDRSVRVLDLVRIEIAGRWKAHDSLWLWLSQDFRVGLFLDVRVYV